MNDNMSTTAFNITPTTMITNHNNEQYAEATLNNNERANVNDGRPNQRDREKGERENKEDDVKRTWTMRERTIQTNKNTDSVTPFTNEQYNCSNVNNSMANYFSSSFNNNNILSSNNRHCREYEPSYPSITRYRTSLSSSPYRKTHYLDDSDEEIIQDEILEIINLKHYPTLIERWGDDTKPIIQQQGEYKIEDYVEFEEIEPTITEEISYEIIYSGEQIQSTREIHHSYSESRNFRKLKKRRIKRKRTTHLFNEIHHSSSYQNDLSGDHRFTKRLKQTYNTYPSIINGIQSSNIDLIDESISLESLKSDEEKKDLFDITKQRYQNNTEEEIDQSYVPSNDIISRIESSINESNDNCPKIAEKELQVYQEGTIEIPTPSAVNKDEFTRLLINEENSSLTNTDQDLQSFLNSLLSHLISDSFDENEQSSSDAYTHTSIPSDQIKIEKLTIDKQQDNESSQSTSFDHQSPTQFESTNTINEQISSDSLIELVRQIRTIPLITRLPSTDTQTDLTHIFKQETISEDTKKQDESKCLPIEGVCDILITSLPLHLSPVDLQTETIEPIERKVENPIINSLIEIAQQIKTIPLTSVSKTEDSTVQHTREDENQSDSNIIESVQKPFYDIETTSTDDAPDTLVNIHLPSADIKTETRYTEEQTDEKSITSLPDEVEKQPEIISIQSKTTTTTIPEEELSQQTSTSKNESIATDSVTETAKAIVSNERQPLISPETKEDANVEFSSDFLVDIVRQIRTSVFTTHSPSVNHAEQVVEESTKDLLTDITEQTSITSIPTTDIKDNELLKSSSHINKSTSTITDTNAQTNSKSSIQNDVPNQLEFLTTPIVSESSDSTDKNELLHHADSNSIPDTSDILQQSIEINPINQTTTESSYSISELTNIMDSIRTYPTTTMSEEFTNIPQQSETIEHTSSPNFFIPETLTSSETDFRDLYQQRYFPFTTIEQPLSNFTSVDDKQFDEKKTASDLTKIYYELQEQRHIQHVLNHTQIEPKQEISDVNLKNHIEHVDIESFSLMSNLPSKEYRQVFGVPDDIVNTVDDLTYSVDQTLQSSVSNEKPQIIETFEDHPSITSVDQEEIITEAIPSLTSNAELDVRYTSLLDRINTLIKPLVDLSLSSFITENESISSDIKEDKDSTNVIDYATSVVPNIISNIASSSSLTTTNEDITISSDTDTYNEKDVQSQMLTPTVTDSEVVVSTSSEEKAPKAEDDEQHQSSSIGLLDIMNHLLSSAHQTKTPPSASSEEQNPAIDKQQKIVNSSNVPSQVIRSIEEPISTTESTISDAEIQSPIVNNEAMVISKPSEETEIKEIIDQQQPSSTGLFEIMKNLFPATLLSKTPTETTSESIQSVIKTQEQEYSTEDQQIEVSTTPLQSSTTKEEEDTQEQVIQIPKQPVSSNYIGYSNQYQVATTEVDRLSTTHQSVTIDHKQPDESEKKSSYQQLQVINDDYPWYSSYYIIIDAEAKIARLYKQLNLFSEHSPSPTIVKIENELQEKVITENYELQDKQDKDEDGFHIVQRRKRIPSSTTHEKTVPSTIITTKPTLSPDIDLEPVILHGHSDAPIFVSPIIPQTTDTTIKKKLKKKKKDKKEMILFDAPELTLSDINKQKIDTTQSQVEKDEHQKNIEMSDAVFIDQTLNHELEQLHPIPTIISNDQESAILSTSIISNTEELKQIDDQPDESTSSNTSQVLSIPVITSTQDVKVNAQLIEQQPTDEESTLQSSPSSIKTIRTKVIALPKEEEEKEEDDNEGFQLVSYRKRILSAAKSEQTPSSTPDSKEILSSDIDQKTSVILEHQSLPTSATTDTQSSTSKKKKNKHKKHKKEIDSSSSIDSSKVEQEPTDQETVLQSHITSSSSIIKDSNVPSKLTLPSTIKTTTIRTKPSVSPEEEEDNEGFQVVSYHKRIISASRFANTPPSSLSKTKYEQNISLNIDHKPAVLHGRHGSASSSIPRRTLITKTSSNQNKQVRSKQDRKQTSLFSAPPRSASAETHITTSTSPDNSFRTPKDIKPKIEQPPPTSDEYQQRLKSPKRETTLDVKPKLDHSSPMEQSTKQIVKEHPVSTKQEINTADEQSSIEKIVPSTALSDSNTDTEKHTLIEDDNDGFQVARDHKHIPSSTTSKELSLTSSIDQKSTDTYAKNDSSLSTSAPEIVIPQSTTPKKKSKKPKMNKNDTLSSLTTDRDSIPLSVEETTDRKASDHIQQVPEPQITSANHSSTSDETTLINTTYETITSQITEPLYQTDDTQSQLHSIKSATSSTTPIEEVSTPSNELPTEVDNLSIAQSVIPTSFSQISSTDIPSTTNQIENELITKETLPATSIEPIINTEDEHLKTTPTKKAAKRRKKKSHTKEKPDDENLLISSTSTAATTLITHPNIESNDVKQESNLSTVEKSDSTENTNESFRLPPEILSEEINNKLDLFLPEYIRQQVNTHQTTSSIPTSSSDINQKKKSRPKMLQKDHEAKSLLTNEFDNTTNTKKQYTQQTTSTNDDIPNKSEEKSTNISSEQTVDNVLSRGFYLWLQESQALSQQKDNLTNIIQNIVIQPTTTNDDDEDEDSWNTLKTIQSTYTIGIQPKKSIHITNAYLINHPESISIPSSLTAQSNKNTFQDNPEKFHSDNEDDSMMNDTLKKQTDIQSNSNTNHHQQTNFTTDNVQQCLDEDFYRQIDNNPSINFDDWAHFLEEKNSYHIGDDLSTSLECFYTQTFDDDTLISDTIPIHHSIKNDRQRYGDFLASNNDEITMKLSASKSKPSEYFQNWRKQESTTISDQNDDEMFISHSNDGLSRRVKP